MPPTTFSFKWDMGHISPFFFLKKNQGAPKKQHCCFCCFFEKIDLSKNTFFPKWSKFLRSKIEKRPKIANRRLPDPKIILEELSVKTHGVARNFGRGPPDHDFRPFFRKTGFAATFFPGTRVKIWSTAHARGYARAYILSEINCHDHICLQNKFWGNWKELWRYTFLQKIKEKKFKKTPKCRKFPLVFSLEFSKKMSFFCCWPQNRFFEKMA